MSLNQKITLFSIVVFLTIAPYLGSRLYRHFRFTAATPQPPALRAEVTITILPGWNLRQIAEYLVTMKLASSTEAVFELTGVPAEVRSRRAGPPPNLVPELTTLSQKPPTISYEGYLAPETYRVFADASLESIVAKLMKQRSQELTGLMVQEKSLTDRIFGSEKGLSDLTVHQIMTMASIVEREAQTPEDKKIVAGILWRRAAAGAALQVDSSVHYIVARTGDVFTTEQERAIDSLWNTYKYPGLPPGPISSPSIATVQATLDPTLTGYWYFLSGSDGKIHYAKTLEEHAANRAKYL